MATCFVHRRPLPAPVTTLLDAVDALACATDDGMCEGVVVACVDAGRRPLGLFVVEGTADPLPVLDAVLAAAAGSVVGSLFTAVCRPSGPDRVEDGDVRLFVDALARCDAAGIPLLDHFVLCAGTALSVGSAVGPTPWRR
jgi:hypothetical protein